MFALTYGNGFVSNNYAPSENCTRMYFTLENANRIDFAREQIEFWKNQGAITESEYYYLLAGLIEGVPYVSNTTGTYGAYLKDWDKRRYSLEEGIRGRILLRIPRHKSPSSNTLSCCSQRAYLLG